MTFPEIKPIKKDLEPSAKPNKIKRAKRPAQLFEFPEEVAVKPKKAKKSHHTEKSKKIKPFKRGPKCLLYFKKIGTTLITKIQEKMDPIAHARLIKASRHVSSIIFEAVKWPFIYRDSLYFDNTYHVGITSFDEKHMIRGYNIATYCKGKYKRALDEKDMKRIRLIKSVRVGLPNFCDLHLTARFFDRRTVASRESFFIEAERLNPADYKFLLATFRPLVIRCAHFKGSDISIFRGIKNAAIEKAPEMGVEELALFFKQWIADPYLLSIQIKKVAISPSKLLNFLSNYEFTLLWKMSHHQSSLIKNLPMEMIRRPNLMYFRILNIKVNCYGFIKLHVEESFFSFLTVANNFNFATAIANELMNRC